eukprot:1174893-Rhodomonas_salina.1
MTPRSDTSCSDDREKLSCSSVLLLWCTLLSPGCDACRLYVIMLALLLFLYSSSFVLCCSHSSPAVSLERGGLGAGAGLVRGWCEVAEVQLETRRRNLVRYEGTRGYQPTVTDVRSLVLLLGIPTGSASSGNTNCILKRFAKYGGG